MQQVSGWPTDLSATTPSHQVVVNGAAVTAKQYSIAASIPGPVPGADSVVARQGSFTLTASESDAFTRQRSPWHKGAVPVQGDAVGISAGYSPVSAPLFTGTVDRSSGSVPGDVDVDVVDRFDRLRKNITVEPLMAKMPPYADAGAYRHIGISPTYFTDRILRYCGFNATPARRAGSAISVPFMGSTWPEYGALGNSSMLGDANGQPAFKTTNWGMGVAGVTATYYPVSYTPGTRDLEVALMVGPAGTSGTVTLAVYWGAQYVRIQVTATRSVIAAIYDGATLATPATLAAAAMTGARNVVLRVTNAGVWTLTADNGQTVTGNAAIPASMTGQPFTSVQVSSAATATPIGGLTVGVHAASDPAPAFTQTAILTPAAYPATLGASPAINNRSCAELLIEQAKAELASFWIDELGRVNWRNRDEIINGAPVATLTAADSIISYDWEFDTSSTYSKVAVANEFPRTRVTDKATITVWQGAGQTFDPGEIDEQIAHPATDEDWVNVDSTFETIGIDSTIAGFNRGRRTWVGAIRVSDDQVEYDASGYVTVEFSVLDYSSFLFRHTISSSVPAGYSVVLKTSKDGLNGVWGTWRGQNLPILRAYGRINWDHRTTASLTVGNQELPELSHEAAWWVQHPTAVQSLADYIATRYTKPTPRIRSLSVVPDARAQLGDIVTVSDPVYSGVSLRCLIVGLDISGSDGQQEMSLSVLVLSATATSVTYDELDAVWAGKTYAQFDAAWAALTYGQLDTNPLEVTP